MGFLRRKVTNAIGADPAEVTHRDGSLETVSVLTAAPDDRLFVFRYPYQKHDWGREIPRQYVRRLPFFKVLGMAARKRLWGS